ncbi:MAG: hypothetical protein ACJASZ_001460 [Yoonia sp.]|jgi:hypothetical protein
MTGKRARDDNTPDSAARVIRDAASGRGLIACALIGPSNKKNKIALAMHETAVT